MLISGSCQSPAKQPIRRLDTNAVLSAHRQRGVPAVGGRVPSGGGLSRRAGAWPAPHAQHFRLSVRHRDEMARKIVTQCCMVKQRTVVFFVLMILFPRAHGRNSDAPF